LGYCSPGGVYLLRVRVVDQRGEPFASLIQETGGAHGAEARGWGLNCFVFVPRVWTLLTSGICLSMKVGEAEGSESG